MNTFKLSGNNVCQTLAWLVLMLMPTALLAAQTDQIRFTRIAQGLTQRSINASLQDQQGFLWFGTEDGLNRYDGYQFKQFKHDPDDPSSLSNNFIESLYQDKQGTLWIGTRGGGLNRYNANSHTFKRFVHNPSDSQSLSHNSVKRIVEDHYGTLWIGTLGGGLNRLNKNTQSFTHFRYQAGQVTSISDDNILSLSQSATGALWIGTNNGLNRFDVLQQTFTRFLPEPSDKHSLSNGRIYALYEDNDAVLWVGTEQGLSQYHHATDRFTKVRPPLGSNLRLDQSDIRVIVQDNTRTLWVGTATDGLLKIDLTTGQINQFRNNPANPYSLSNDSISSIIQDSSGILWFGSIGKALNKYDRTTDHFNHYRHDPTDPSSIGGDQIRAIFEDHNRTLWVGTQENGLSNKTPFSDHFNHIRQDANRPNGLSHNNVSVIFADDTNTLWIGTMGGGLNASVAGINDDTFKHFKHDPKDPFSLSNDSIRAIKQDSQGTLWVATHKGLNKWTASTGKFTRYFDSGAQHKLFALHIDTQDVLWIGTLGGGLIRFDPRLNDIKTYLNDAKIPGSLSNNDVLSLYQNDPDLLWLGTHGGLNLFNIKTQSFTVYDEKQGLANNTIYGILSDTHDNLWMSTNNGISRFNYKIKHFKNFHVGDGLSDNEFNGGAYAKGRDGKLFFGNNKGLNSFYPNKIRNAPQAPKVALTNFLLFNQSVPIHADIADGPLQQAIEQTTTLTLNHRQSVFAFEFAALHYGAPEKNLYAYQLVGFDPNWIKTGAQNRRATYTNLGSGDYQFNVKGSNKDGVWGLPVSINLTILPPPWLTWWAFCGYFLLATVIFTLLFGQHLQKHKALLLAKNNAEQARRNAELAQQYAEKANQAKSSFVADVSHEIRTPLNAILGYTQLLGRDPVLGDKQKQKIEIIEKSGDHLLGLINNILDIAKLEANAMTLVKEDFELVDLVQSIGIMLGVRCDEKNLAWRFDNQCDNFVAVHGDHGRLRQILINLLGNAVKFTNRGSITLSLSCVATDHYCFEISDTGVGIAPKDQDNIFEAFGQTTEGIEQGGTGLGLAIASKQVALMGGQLQLSSAPGQGSRFYFTLSLPPAKAAIQTDNSRQTQVVKLMPDVSVTALVVDDIKDNRHILSQVLEKVGICVTQARSGPEALKLLHQADALPDLIFMDIRMPIMEGVEVLTHIRRDFKDNCPACIAVTANAMQQDVEHYQKVGFDHYISSPFRFEAIYDCIHHLLHVDFEYQQSPLEQVQTPQTNDFSNLRIPNTLYHSITRAAADYEISKLEDCLTELGSLNELSKQFAYNLSQYLTSYDIEGLLKALNTVQCSDN